MAFENVSSSTPFTSVRRSFAPSACDPASTRRTLVWVDRSGQEQPIRIKARLYGAPRISPDGIRIAVHAEDDEHDIWIFDVEKETLTRLMTGPANEYHPGWSAPPTAPRPRSRSPSAHNVVIRCSSRRAQCRSRLPGTRRMEVSE